MHPRIILHRGIINRQSIVSAKKQLAQGTSSVEVDLDVSKDGVVFIFHDSRIGLYIFREPYFIKKNGIKKKAHQLLFSEIQKLFPDVVEFSELIKEIPPSHLLCELKSYTAYKGIVHILHRMYPDAFHKLRFISFSMCALLEVKSIDSNIYCSYIATSGGDDKRFHPLVLRQHLQKCLKNGIEEISGYWLTFRPRMIRRAHQLGLKVGIGQINTTHRILYAQKNEVDVWYTDVTEHIVDYIRS